MNITNINEKQIKIKIKSKNDNIENDYIEHIYSKILTNIQPTIKMEKVDDECIHIPKFNESNFLLKYNYNALQLKVIAKKHKLKVTGNKTQLISRIYSFLFLSNSIIKIQKIMRGHLQRKYIISCGTPKFPPAKNTIFCSKSFFRK